MERDMLFALVFAILIAIGFAFAPIKYSQPAVVSHIIAVFAVGMASFGTLLGVFTLHNFHKLFSA